MTYTQNKDFDPCTQINQIKSGRRISREFSLFIRSAVPLDYTCYTMPLYTHTHSLSLYYKAYWFANVDEMRLHSIVVFRSFHFSSKIYKR